MVNYYSLSRVILLTKVTLEVSLNIDFQSVLAEFLFRNKHLALPGLGTLIFESKPASLQASQSKILPPTVVLKHFDADGDVQSLVSYVSNKLNLDDIEVSNALLSWMKSKMELLRNGGVLEIADVGYFTLDQSGKPKFIADEDALAWLPQLPELQAIPVIHDIGHVPPTTTPREEKDLVIPMLLVAVLLLCALWYVTWPIMFGESENRTKEEHVDPDLPAKEERIAAIDTSSDKPLIPSEDSLITKEEYREEEIPEQGGEDVVSKAFNKECIIIVGSFRKNVNAERMVSKIESLGYTVHTEDYNGLQRVGVSFDCLTKDLYRTLFQLRGKFGEDAWILKYK